MLDSITACSLEFRSRVVFIVLAVLSLIGGLMFVADEPEVSIGCIVLGVVFAVLYAWTRGQVVEFTTSGATIKVGSSGRSLEEVRQLVETVEAAKNARYTQRFSHGSIGNSGSQSGPTPVA